MRKPDIANNPDFQRKALVTILGIMVIVGAFWAATSPAETLATVNNDEKKLSALATPEVEIEDNIFQREYFGYPVLCGMLNTDDYGHPETVDEARPIFDSAGEIFEEMGTRVDQDTKVMVIKGLELSFRDTKKGILYTVDANGTVYCQTARE